MLARLLISHLAIAAALSCVALLATGCSQSQLAAEDLLERGEQNRLSGNYKKAIVDYTRAIELPDATNTTLLSSHYLRGVCYNYTGEYELAIADLTRVLSQLTSDDYPKPEILTERARVYIKLNNRAGAISDLERVLEIKPDNSSAVELLAKAKKLAIKNVHPTLKSDTLNTPKKPLISVNSFEAEVLQPVENLVGDRSIYNQRPNFTIAYFLYDGPIATIEEVARPWVLKSGFTDINLSLQEAHRSDTFIYLKNRLPPNMTLKISEVIAYETVRGDNLSLVCYEATADGEGTTRMLQVSLYNQ